MSSAITFYNPGHLDLRAIRTFGLSAKENENPIGFFGTGLKYAVAVAARLEVPMRIRIGDREHQLSVQPNSFRNKQYQSLHLDGQELPFTTELGKTWELWQMFRELYCNALDEGGDVRAGGFEHYPEGTQISLDDPRTFELYTNREGMLIRRPPDHIIGGVEVYESNSLFAYYRRVRMNTLLYPTFFTYSVKEQLDLTEDRTLKYLFNWENEIARSLAGCNNEYLLRHALTTGDGFYEFNLGFDRVCSSASDTFLKVMKPLMRDFSGRVNPSAKKLYTRLSKKTELPEESISLSEVEFRMLSRAKEVCRDLGHDLDVPIIIVSNLGGGLLGLCKGGRIYLTKEAFDGGTKLLAGTLMEELIHHEKGYLDMTRQLQNFLVNRIMSLYEEAKGDPL